MIEWNQIGENVWVVVDSVGKSRTVITQGTYLGQNPPAPKYVVSGDGYETTEHFVRQEALDAAENSLRENHS